MKIVSEQVFRRTKNPIRLEHSQNLYILIAKKVIKKNNLGKKCHFLAVVLLKNKPPRGVVISPKNRRPGRPRTKSERWFLVTIYVWSDGVPS
jgi:hypothetical protein